MSCRHNWLPSYFGAPWYVVDYCDRCLSVRRTDALLGIDGGIRGELLGKIHRYYTPNENNAYFYSGRYKVILLPKWEGDPIANDHVKRVQKASQRDALKTYWNNF